MFGWFYSWSTSQICALIDEVDKKRKLKRLQGETMKSTFADDLKDSLNGVIIQEPEEQTQAEQTQEDQDENVKMYIKNQFGNE